MLVIQETRHAPSHALPAVKRIAHGSTGFLMWDVGGSGTQVGNRCEEINDLSQNPLTFERVQYDLDKGQHSTAQRQVDVSLSPSQAREVKANARLFGQSIETAVHYVGDLLDPMEVEAGARTTRSVTQIAVAYHRDEILSAIAKAVASLMSLGRFTRIQPIINTSLGGGTGSACAVLLPALVKRPDARARILAGLDPDLLMPPIIMAAAPYAYVRNYTTRSQGTKVLANYYATNREFDGSLLRREIAYVITMGYSNSAGMVNDTPDRMVDVLATSALHFMANYSYFKGRWVDSVPAAGQQPYGGIDTPENIFPTVRALREKFYPQEKQS